MKFETRNPFSQTLGFVLIHQNC